MGQEWMTSGVLRLPSGSRSACSAELRSDFPMKPEWLECGRYFVRVILKPDGPIRWRSGFSCCSLWSHCPLGGGAVLEWFLWWRQATVAVPYALSFGISGWASSLSWRSLHTGGDSFPLISPRLGMDAPLLHPLAEIGIALLRH
ncbi:hypothetical protein Nepgr_006657 [Nepenthes gracilis]|uniref:Uncharacterized protein n=1 Tax=Nepenthes gracilis TaxID=150966 RepID=A0AAD3S6A2_NEPGR|nr:hypothetical protein Nepgr_006657 [Nepenthes gracilis]